MCKDDKEEKLQWENKGIEKNEKIAVKERAGGEKDLQSKKETKGEKKKRLSGDERKVKSNGYGWKQTKTEHSKLGQMRIVSV